MPRSSHSRPQVASSAEPEEVTGPGGPGGYAAEDPVEDTTAPPSRRLEVTCAAIAVVASGVLILLARGIEVRRETDGLDPRWWPALLGTVGLGLAVILLVLTLVRPPFRRDDLETTTRRGWVRMLAAVALTVGFVAVWPLVGFLVATPVFLVAVTYLFGARGWKATLLFPVLLTGFVYLLFDALLKVPL